MGLASAGAQLISLPPTGSSSCRRRIGTPFQLPYFRFTSPLPFRKCGNRSDWKWKGKREKKGGKVCYSVEGVEDDDDDDAACELVNGMELSIGEQPHHSIPAYLFKAVKNNNGTAILLLSDLFAFQHSSIRDFAYRLACNGFNVLLPDLIHGDSWKKQSTKRDMQRIAEDIGTVTKWLVDEFSAAGLSRKLGIMGFGYGGGQVIEVLARDEGACFCIGASLYGTEVDPSLATKVKVPVLLISGDNDPLCPVSVMKDLEKRMGEGSKLVIFGGRGHDFVHNPRSPEEDEDAEQAFLMIRNWLHHGLVATNI
ncbi:hydrolase tropI [Benincasa hispida]|uniref:hydrolase tropI n=1 Tax=Benincasa hispida TaxID=102211 RepID=UPI001902BA46|nr:hydrolase tropI [Benincasa hispida]